MKICKNLIQFYLSLISRLCVLLYRPKIIVIAGSQNKTLIKEKIEQGLLHEGYELRKEQKSYNTIIGLPLAILNLETGYRDIILWIKICFLAFLKIFKPLPKLLVLELGVDQKNEMKKLLFSIGNPYSCIITNIKPVFSNDTQILDIIKNEMKVLINKLTHESFLILNESDSRLKNLVSFYDGKKYLFTDENKTSLEIAKEISNQLINFIKNNLQI